VASRRRCGCGGCWHGDTCFTAGLLLIYCWFTALLSGDGDAGVAAEDAGVAGAAAAARQQAQVLKLLAFTSTKVLILATPAARQQMCSIYLLLLVQRYNYWQHLLQNSRCALKLLAFTSTKVQMLTWQRLLHGPAGAQSTTHTHTPVPQPVTPCNTCNPCNTTERPARAPAAATSTAPPPKHPPSQSRDSRSARLHAAVCLATAGTGARYVC
jgi:hypothetical protein